MFSFYVIALFHFWMTTAMKVEIFTTKVELFTQKSTELYAPRCTEFLYTIQDIVIIIIIIIM